MTTSPNHRRGHGRIREVRCSCWVCRMGRERAAAVKQQAADVTEREQREEQEAQHVGLKK